MFTIYYSCLAFLCLLVIDIILDIVVLSRDKKNKHENEDENDENKK